VYLQARQLADGLDGELGAGGPWQGGGPGRGGAHSHWHRQGEGQLARKGAVGCRAGLAMTNLNVRL
jgi:hypothetical protein